MEGGNSTNYYSCPRWRQSRSYELFHEFTEVMDVGTATITYEAESSTLSRNHFFKKDHINQHKFMIIRQLFRIHVPFKIITYIQNSSASFQITLINLDISFQ